MTARNRVVREPYATWCGRTPVEIIHGLLPDSGFSKAEGIEREGDPRAHSPSAGAGAPVIAPGSIVISMRVMSAAVLAPSFLQSELLCAITVFSEMLSS